jgi:hypothetical protein
MREDRSLLKGAAVIVDWSQVDGRDLEGGKWITG